MQRHRIHVGLALNEQLNQRAHVARARRRQVGEGVLRKRHPLEHGRWARKDREQGREHPLALEGLGRPRHGAISHGQRGGTVSTAARRPVAAAAAVDNDGPSKKAHFSPFEHREQEARDLDVTLQARAVQRALRRRERV